MSNLLNTGTLAIWEGQATFQTASKILDTLNIFGRRLTFKNTSSPNTTLQENNIQLQVADIDSGTRHDFMPNLANALVDIQANAPDMPLQGATIMLPIDLLTQLSSSQEAESLQVLNILWQTDAFFVMDNTTELGDEADVMVGNLIVTANIFDRGNTSQKVTVTNLTESQSVVIKFNLTEVHRSCC